MATIGERIKEIRKEHNLTLDQLGEIAGASKQFLSQVENGKKEPGKDTLRNICDHFNIDMDYIIGRSDVKNALNFEGIYSKGVEHGRSEAIKEIKTLNVLSNVVSIPIYSALSCGTGTWVDEMPEDYVSVPESMMFHGKAFANFAEGDSMEPKIRNGDLLIFQETPVVPSGSVGSFSLNDAYCCKRFKQLADGSCWLFSDNPEYDPIPIKPNDDFRTLGIYKLKLSKEQ